MGNPSKPLVTSDLANPVAERNFKRLMVAGLEGGEIAMRQEWNHLFPDDPVKVHDSRTTDGKTWPSRLDLPTPSKQSSLANPEAPPAKV